MADGHVGPGHNPKVRSEVTKGREMIEGEKRKRRYLYFSRLMVCEWLGPLKALQNAWFESFMTIRFRNSH
jgi:hypothetical protein